MISQPEILTEPVPLQIKTSAASSNHVVGRQDTAIWPGMANIDLEQEHELMLTNEDQLTVVAGVVSPCAISTATLTAPPVSSNVLIEDRTDLNGASIDDDTPVFNLK